MTISAQESTTLLETLRNQESKSPQSLTEPKAVLAYTKLVTVMRSLQWGTCLIFFLIGTLAAPMSFETSEEQRINIFWLLGVLLGAHFFSLALWCVSLIINQRKIHYSASILSSISQHLAPRLNVPQLILEAFIEIRVSGKRAKWLSARLIHSFWGSYLLGGLSSVLFFLMTHQVHFFWETTLLTSNNFAALTHGLSVLPGLLGIPVPSFNDIQQSQWSVVSQSEPLRQMWAIWLLACVLIYGVFVRGVLILICHLNYRLARMHFFKSHASTTSAPVATSYVIDPDVHKPTHLTESSAQDTLPTVAQLPMERECYLFEWSRPIPQTLISRSWQSIASMAEQKAFLSTNSPAAILINCQTSPDRGSLRFMTQTLTKNTHYYLVGEVFVTDWQQALLGVGVPHNTITKLVE